MSGGDIAGLIAAGVFALLVLLLAVPILKLGRVFDEVNISALSSLVAATVGSPLIKVAAFSYGVRSALAARKKPAGRRSR